MPGVGRPGRAWGWHALADEWAERIVEDADILPGEHVLDIGAGEGALTKHLVAAGARVTAVELNPGRAQHLRDRFAGMSVKVVQVDAASLRLPARRFRVVASPPYAVTAALLRLLLASGSRLLAADLVLQRAVVARYARGLAPGAGRWLQGFELYTGRTVPRRAFRPPPRVDSSVLVIRRRVASASPAPSRFPPAPRQHPPRRR